MGIIGIVVGLGALVVIVSMLPESITGGDIDFETMKNVGYKIIDTINIWRA